MQLNVRAIRKLQSEALQNYVLGLGLVALLAPADLDLREGCNLVIKSTATEAVNEDGSRTAFKMTYAEALEFAKEASRTFGVGLARQFTYSEARVRERLIPRRPKARKM